VLERVTLSAQDGWNSSSIRATERRARGVASTGPRMIRRTICSSRGPCAPWPSASVQYLSHQQRRAGREQRGHVEHDGHAVAVAAVAAPHRQQAVVADLVVVFGTAEHVHVEGGVAVEGGVQVVERIEQGVVVRRRAGFAQSGVAAHRMQPKVHAVAQLVHVVHVQRVGKPDLARLRDPLQGGDGGVVRQQGQRAAEGLALHVGPEDAVQVVFERHALQ